LPSSGGEEIFTRNVLVTESKETISVFLALGITRIERVIGALRKN
jgi:hypothetical protein